MPGIWTASLLGPSRVVSLSGTPDALSPSLQPGDIEAVALRPRHEVGQVALRHVGPDNDDREYGERDDERECDPVGPVAHRLPLPLLHCSLLPYRSLNPRQPLGYRRRVGADVQPVEAEDQIP